MVRDASKSVFSIEPKRAVNLYFGIYYIRQYAWSASINRICPSADFGIGGRRLRILTDTDKTAWHTRQHPNIPPALKNLLGVKQYKLPRLRKWRSDRVINSRVDFINNQGGS